MNIVVTAGRLMRVRRGQSLVEFPIVAAVLFVMVFGIMDFGRLFFAEMTLQSAVREAGRYAVTGQHLADPNNPGQTLTRIASITQVAQQKAAGLSVANIIISSAGTTGSAGGPGQTVSISLTYSFKFITPFIAKFFSSGQYTFTVGTTFRNEPFPPSQAT